MTLSRPDKALFTKIWVYTVLALIGHSFDYGGGDICGAVASCRRSGDRISVWTRWHGNRDKADVVKVRGMRA